MIFKLKPFAAQHPIGSMDEGEVIDDPVLKAREERARPAGSDIWLAVVFLILLPL